MAKKQNQGIWGIEIGQCAFKALRLELIDGLPTATAFDFIEHAKILSQPDADPDQLTREALAKFLERNPLGNDVVVIGLPGQSGLARFVKLPPVEEKKITDIVRFEAKQQIPFPLDEVIWDYQKIGSGVVTDGFAMETEIGLFAMKKDMIQRYLQHFIEANVEVHVIQMSPLALCNYISFDLLKKGGESVESEERDSTAVKGSADATFKRRCIVALDIGTDNSNLVITDGERIIWQRPIPKGGNHFTRALTKEMKLTFAKAEHLKRNATKSPDLKRILAALKPELNDFVNEVQRSLGFFTNTHRDAHVEYMVGLGNAFRLPGLQKFLSEKLAIDVRKLQKLERLEGDSVVTAPAFTNNVLSFATVYGLALQGLKLSHLQTNLLPPDIQIARMVRAKKPWAVAAAAALMFGMAATAAGYSLQYKAVAGNDVLSAQKAGNDLISRVDKFKKDYALLEAKCKENEDAVKAIIAGQDERLNWILMNRYVNDCLPAPALRIDGKIQKVKDDKSGTIVDHSGKVHTITLDENSTLLVGGKLLTGMLDLKEGQEVAVVYQADKGAKDYWTTRQPGTGRYLAKEAYLSYWARQSGNKDIESRADDDGVEDLIQVNIEGVSALYTGDLKLYFEELKKKKDYADGMVNKKEAETPPEGKGWVVEVRGYTYNRALTRFVTNTFVANLANKAIKANVPAPGAQGTTPVAPVAPPASAPAEDKGKDAEKDKKDSVAAAEKKKADEFDKSIANRISHVVLYDSKAVTNPDPAKFALIGTSVLPDLVKSGGNWQSLLANAGGNAGEFGRGPGGGGGPGAFAPGMMMKEKGGAAVGGEKEKEKEKDTDRRGPRRTEFVILFIWNEPTPSDDRMERPTATPQGQQGGPGAGPGGPMGPGGGMGGAQGGVAPGPTAPGK